MSHSEFKGVYWNERLSKWVAAGILPGTTSCHNIGTFADKFDAAHAYDAWANQFPGNELNFPRSEGAETGAANECPPADGKKSKGRILYYIFKCKNATSNLAQ